jgi:hypothetical protein
MDVGRLELDPGTRGDEGVDDIGLETIRDVGR